MLCDSAAEFRGARVTHRADGAGHGQGGCTGFYAPRAGNGVLREGRGGDGDHAVRGLEQAGVLIVGVAGALGKRCAVQRDTDVAENGGEGVADDGVIRRCNGGVAVVLQTEGVGHFAVFRYGDGRDRLEHTECRADCRRYIFGRVNVTKSRAADGDGVFDHTACLGWRVFRDLCFIDDHGAAARGDADIAEHQSVRGTDGRSRLQDAVAEIQRGILDIAQRLYRAGVKDIRTEIIRDGQPRHRGIAVVDDTHGVGHRFTRLIILRGGGFADAEDALDRSDRDI